VQPIPDFECVSQNRLACVSFDSVAVLGNSFHVDEVKYRRHLVTWVRGDAELLDSLEERDDRTHFPFVTRTQTRRLHCIYYCRSQGQREKLLGTIPQCMQRFVGHLFKEYFLVS
jgi:hypothetical protein